MATTLTAEKSPPWYYPRMYRRGLRARVIIKDLREHNGFHDPIHGIIPDTRPLPQAWTLGLMLSANRMERFLQWFVEDAIIPPFLKTRR